MKFLGFVLFFVGFVFSSKADEHGCKFPKHYQELGCKPIYQNNETCASSFDCDHLKTRNSDNCYYNGKVFNSSADIKREELPHCVQWASCQFGSFFSGHFDCTLPFLTLEEYDNCIVYDQHDICCQRKICGKQEIAEYLPECWFEGQRHFKGEVMKSTKDDCMECLCDEKFNNATEIYQNPSCKPKDCAIEFWYYNKIHDGCTPIYYGTEKCCPGSTKCPSPEDKVITPEHRPPNPSGLKCKFGPLELEIGDRVNHDLEKCVECECKTPPMVECRLNNKCWSDNN